jgi:hypothetical protein
MPTDVFVLRTGGAHTSHLSTKRLEVAKAASNNIFTMQSDLPSRVQKELRK